MIVDRVSEVLDIAPGDIVDAPTLGAGLRTGYLLGIGRAGGRIRLLLDIDRVLSDGEHAELHALQSAPAA
jgi:purine-binding chemotaxis protein CheW